MDTRYSRQEVLGGIGKNVQMKRALALISAGIDSPVAAWKMRELGLEVIAVHFSNEPLASSKAREKTIELCMHLHIPKLYIVKHGFLVHAELMRKCDDKMRCVLCKRMMLRVSEQIAKKENCDFLLMGDNLGQVASQTLENMTVASSAVKMPILRPLLCNDKQEIVDIAKKIGTYQLSVEAASCCNAVPKMPVTKAHLAKIEGEESKIDVDGIVKEAIATAQVMELEDNV